MLGVKIIVLFLVCLGVFTFHSEDEVINLPDYHYQGRMHSGYLSLQDPRKKLHYILVESERDPVNDPLVLWLNGGPGCSSLGGFSQEHGPALFVAGSAEWKLNPYNWNKEANVLYLESPAGVGFSYIESDSDDDWYSDDEKSAKENLEALISFFEKFPELSTNEFFISGESYAGIYIPFLARNILEHNKDTDVSLINLKGILVGNGVTDWKVDAENAMIDYAFNHALYSSELRQAYLSSCFNNLQEAECSNITDQINELIGKVNVYAIYDQCFTTSSTKYFTKQRSKYMYTPWLFKNKGHSHLNFLEGKSKEGPPCIDSIGFDIYYSRDDVKKALHVKTDLEFELCSEKVSSFYKMDRNKGSIGLYPELLESGIRIFIFSGDTDAVVAFNGTEKWIKSLNLKTLSQWRAWTVSDKANIGGYVTKYDGLTFITVRGAGHMVPQYRPKEAFYMLTRFLKGNDL